MPQRHLNFQCLEVVRHTGLDLPTHPLASPLLKAAKFLIDIHVDFHRGSHSDHKGLVLRTRRMRFAKSQLSSTAFECC